MSTIKSSAENLTLNADGANNDIIFQSNGTTKVTLDGQNKGTVLTVNADGVTITGLIIINSGHSHDDINSAIRLTSSHNKITHNIIYDTLFGIDLKEAHHNLVTHNDIQSKKVDLGLRGDGIRGWASNNNTFRFNKIHNSRDMVIWYSYDNIIEDNVGKNNRYSLHFMYTGRMQVRRNKYSHSAVGIFLMYSQSTTIENNEILFSQGNTGMGIGMKEVDNMKIYNNKIIYCSTGIYIDQSPYKPTTYNLIMGNTVGYNKKGFVFHSSLSRNVFQGNAVIDNLEDVVVHSNGNAEGNVWKGNYWSHYEGFDRNLDGYGDGKYSDYLYQDQLWLNDPWVKFFYASPVLSVINFLARLAPFSQPRLLLHDRKPVFSLDSDVLLSKKNMFFDISDLTFDVEEDDEDYVEEEDGVSNVR